MLKKKSQVIALLSLYVLFFLQAELFSFDSHIHSL